MTIANSFEALSVEEETTISGKACSICGEIKQEEAFSKKQWIAKAHSRKCGACVDSGATAAHAGATAGGKGAVPAAKTPAPWYDENLEPEFQGDTPSLVFDPEYTQLLSRIDRGDVHPDDAIPMGVDPSNEGSTILQVAATQADVPLMKAVLRKGARVDLFNGGATALQMLCGMLNLHGEMIQGRSRIKAVEFLLSIGADPNAKPDPAKGDTGSGTGAFVTATPLHHAILIGDLEISNRMCELLLQHKADPTAKNGEGKTVLNAAHSKGLQTLKALIKTYEAAPRPPLLCPCGSARVYESCHGAKVLNFARYSIFLLS